MHLGTVVFSNQIEDVVKTLASELDRLDIKKTYTVIIEAARRQRDFTRPEVPDLILSLCEAVGTFAPKWSFFGISPDHAHDYGFWPDFDSIDVSFRGHKVSSLVHVPENYFGDVLLLAENGDLSLHVKTPDGFNQIWIYPVKVD